MVAITCALTLLALMLAWCAWRVFRSCPSFIDHPVVFFLPVCGALLVLRLPQIKWNCELNPDESQMLAQGMRFLSHPVPWRDVANQGEKTLRLLDELDEIVLGNGGILYPAKDARMSPRSFETSYPNWKEFAKFIDPHFSSSFWRRVTRGV